MLSRLNRKILTAVALAIFVGSVPCTAGASSSGTEPPSDGGEPAPRRTPSWLEATPLDTKDAPLLAIGEEVEQEPPSLRSGLWMVCAGGGGEATVCERRFVEEPQSASLEPRPGSVVVGRIRLGRAPVAMATVSVVPHGLAARRRFTVPLGLDGEVEELSRAVETDERGAFRLPPLGPGDYLLEIRAGGQLHHGEPFTLEPVEMRSPNGPKRESPAVLDLGEIALAAGITVEVYVTDARGQPLSSARVGAHQGERPTFFEADADETGRAVLTGLEPVEPLSIRCVAEGYQSRRRSFDSPPAAMSCSLPELAALSGRVLDGSEEPVEGATVTLEPGDRRARSDPDGQFSLEGLVAGDYEVRIAAGSYRSERLEVELAAGEEGEMEPVILLPGEEVRGVVRDAVSGAPVAGASVVITDPPGGGGALSDREGEFRLTADRDEALEIEVVADGYPTTRRRVPASELTAEEPVAIELERGGRIEVVAWQRDGEGPCVGCAIGIQPSPGGGRLRTDASGRALSKILAPGRYQVILVDEVSLGSVLRVRGGHNNRHARVRPGQTVTVRFGEPRERILVRFRPPPPPGWRLEARGATWSRFEELAGGEAVISRRPGEAVELTLLGPPRVRVRQPQLPGKLDRDEVTLDLPGGRIQGVLAAPSGGSPAGRRLVVRRPGGEVVAVGRSGASGTFRFPFLPDGVYQLVHGSRLLRTVSVTGRSEDQGVIELPDDGAPRPGQ